MAAIAGLLAHHSHPETKTTMQACTNTFAHTYMHTHMLLYAHTKAGKRQQRSCTLTETLDEWKRKRNHNVCSTQNNDLPINQPQ